MDDELSEYEMQITEGRWRESTTQGGDVLPGSTTSVPPVNFVASESFLAEIDRQERIASEGRYVDLVFGQESDNFGSVYVAGPMTGINEYNFPAFHEAAERFRKAGWLVFNPAENHDGQTDLPLEDYFAADLPQVCKADALALLPGWQNSKGAQIEVALAKHLGKRILDAVTMEDYHESVVQEAQRLVHGDRGKHYGHPSDDFARSGRMWGAILGIPDVPPEKVGLCMAAVKISREVNRPNRDNRVDLAGYAETIEMIHERDDA